MEGTHGRPHAKREKALAATALRQVPKRLDGSKREEMTKRSRLRIGPAVREREQERKLRGVVERPLQSGSGEPMQTASEDAETRRDLKRSAGLPIDDLRSEVRGRVTPTVQTERPADAAEAHKSSKMELILNAAAKMMNAAVASELTSAEVWTLSKNSHRIVWSIRVDHKHIHHRLDNKTCDGQFLGPRNARGQRKIGANASPSTRCSIPVER